MKMIRFSVAFAIGVGAAELPSVAFAQSSKDDADLRWELGNLLFGRGNYNGALAEFLLVYKQRPLAEVEYNLGLTYVHLGHPVEAAEWLGMCLSRAVCVAKTKHAYAQKVYEEQTARIGTVSVLVDVPHVDVEIDGKKRGQAPVSIRLAGGTHIVSVAPDGYEPQYKEIVVAGGTATQVDLHLVPFQGQPARVLVESPTPNVEVFMDDKPVGKTPLWAAIKIVPGAHTLEVRRDGYRPFTQSLEVQGDELRTVQVELAEDGPWIATHGGQLELELSEPHAVVTIDGHSRGEYLGALRVAPGAHRLRLERSGFVTVEREVMVSMGKTTRETVAFEPNPETLAKRREDVATRKQWGKILVGAGTGAVVVGTVTAIGLFQWSSDLEDTPRAGFGQTLKTYGSVAIGGAALGLGAFAGGVWLWAANKDVERPYGTPGNPEKAHPVVLPILSMSRSAVTMGLAGTL